MADAAAGLVVVETLPRPPYDAVRGRPYLEQPTMVSLAHDRMMHGACDPSRRATRALVDLGAIRHNVRLVRAAIGPGVHLMAMVKANAYGHGAVPVARACVEAGATGLAVATVDEGLALRRSGITAPLLVLGASAPEEHPEALRHDLTLAVGSLRMADDVAAAARATGVTARVHVEVDTGMSRFGVPAPRAVEEISALAALPGLELEGIYTHFTAAEEPDRRSARAQLALFTGLLEALAARDVRVPLRHAANSAATLELPEAHLDLVRPGIALYGYHPAGAAPPPPRPPGKASRRVPMGLVAYNRVTGGRWERRHGAANRNHRRRRA